MQKKGFTLLELVVVVIILGILATLGFTQYTKMVEKGRTSEAKMILGQIRTAEIAYTQQYGGYTSTIGSLSVDVPTACTTTHYFSYATPNTTEGRATRCTASGKTPDAGASAGYSLTLSFGAGTFGGTGGYY
ncbi:MAG: prepilin-type N-terminal cleavage/methylation domain-containing protein [Candidatus Omnitrophica bacterium]|nr:prepilin-type N-terminal cleavage/methylation domain-containing protein [Candidatus Omnitrophota bacterium]